MYFKALLLNSIFKPDTTKVTIVKMAINILYEMFAWISLANLYLREFSSKFCCLISSLIFPKELCIIANKLKRNPANMDRAVIKLATCDLIEIL